MDTSDDESSTRNLSTTADLGTTVDFLVAGVMGANANVADGEARRAAHRHMLPTWIDLRRRRWLSENLIERVILFVYSSSSDGYDSDWGSFYNSPIKGRMTSNRRHHLACSCFWLVRL